MTDTNHIGSNGAGSSDSALLLDSSNSFDAIQNELDQLVGSLESLYRDFDAEVRICGITPQENALGLFPNDTVKYQHMFGVVTPSMEDRTFAERFRDFMDKSAIIINRIIVLMRNVITTGLPLMKGIRKKANNMLNGLEGREQIDEPSLNNAKLAKALHIGGEVPSAKDIESLVEHLQEITSTTLSKEKLKDFKQISDSVLLPYQQTIKSKRTDEIVFIMGIIAGLTNPGVIIGEVLKQLFLVAAPNAGKGIDIAATAAGTAFGAGVVGGLVQVLPTVVSGAASNTRDWANGRINVDGLPHFAELYPFCDIKVKEDPQSPYLKKVSRTLPGNMVWTLTDFKPVLGGKMRGSVQKVGGSFGVRDKVKEIKDELPSMDIDGVTTILKAVDNMMDYAASYCLNFRDQTRIYETQFKQIADILAGAELEKLRGTYIRHSYRMAMNQLLGSIWTSCFGSDIKYIRYLVNLSKNLLRYCEATTQAKDQTS